MTRPIDYEKLYRSSTELQNFHTKEAQKLQITRGEALLGLRQFFTVEQLVDRLKLSRSRINALMQAAKNYRLRKQNNK